MRVFKCVKPLKLRVRGTAREIDVAPGMMFTSEEDEGKGEALRLRGIFAPDIMISCLTLRNHFEELGAG